MKANIGISSVILQKQQTNEKTKQTKKELPNANNINKTYRKHISINSPHPRLRESNPAEEIHHLLLLCPTRLVLIPDA